MILAFPRRSCRWLLPTLGCLLALAASAPAFASQTVCTPKFGLQTGQAYGWEGADAAYSIPLPGRRDVWIFGDTLWGPSRVVNKNQPKMVRNSIGISTCDARGHFHLTYVIRRDATGHPRDFFTAQHPHTWYWALDGFVNGRDLWVTLLCVRNAPAASAAMGFATCGTDLARVQYAGADPQKWKIDYFPLVPDGVHAYPSATAVVWGPNAYIFAQQESGTRPLLATRIPLSGLDDPKAHLEYLAASGAWEKGFDPASAQHVMEHGISELSIRYHPELKKWLAVMFDPAGFSSKILLRSAPSLTGPWTEGQVIYQAPEMQAGNPSYDKDTFCYAAKEHPEFERGDLVFTYVCNTFAIPKLPTELNIYFPQVVRMPMPPLSGQ